MAETTWRRVAVFTGATLTGLGGAWFVTWGGIVASTDLPQTRPFWVAASYVAAAAFIIGLLLVVVGELSPKESHNSPFADGRKAEAAADKRIAKTAAPSVETPAPSETVSPKRSTGSIDASSRSERTLYGSLTDSLQAALTEGVSVRDRLRSPNFVVQSFLGYREPATDRDVDEWINDVRSRLRSVPMHLARFDQEKPPAVPWLVLSELASGTHARYSEMNFKLEQLEKIIRELNGD